MIADGIFLRWVNRKDFDGKNVFEGGFLGLDNICVFDRSAPLPTGGTLEQSDGTSWMAYYSLMMMQISLELAADEPAYAGFGRRSRRALLESLRGDHQPAHSGL